MEPFSSQQASKVVHLRSLPNDVTDSEVIQLGMTYGRVANILMLKVFFTARKYLKNKSNSLCR